MNFFDKLNAAIALNQSLLFVGLDPNIEMMPKSGKPDAIAALSDWLQLIIAQTADLVCAYKPTLGFYEALGARGLELLENTLQAIPSHIPVSTLR